MRRGGLETKHLQVQEQKEAIHIKSTLQTEIPYTVSQTVGQAAVDRVTREDNV